MIPLLLAVSLVGPPIPQCSNVKPGTVCVQDDRQEQDRKVIRGLVWDTARIGIGASLDIYSTAYALQRNPSAKEGNPLGFTPEARIALKGAIAVASVLGCHELRVRGHHNVAKWAARGVMALQVGASIHNFRQARRR